ncbi:MAG: ATP-dependent DNA helicase [Candidatus Omnitrophica bacterium]|nr:ATP-dependent DNA helicase [Candidatus Omnitrophota bacterium]
MESIRDRITEGLNSDQIQAVEHGQGPLLIVAGAGTGKTLVLTRRIVYLITSSLAHPEDILALTFTEKAAQEMEERVDILMPYGYTDMTISTFHAFGDRVLKDNALELGMSPDLYVLSKAEQIIFFREHIFEFPLKYFRPLADPTKYIEGILSLISRAKDEDVSPQEYLSYVGRLKSSLKSGSEDEVLKEIVQKESEIAACYQKYQQILHSESKIDFGDQVYLALGLFRKHPSILKKYRERFKYILVDEFQDTNHTQFELLKLLAGDGGNITVCGDDDQSIYKFRGAALSNIMEFMDVYNKAKKIILKKNYRSCQNILDASYRLISHNNPDRLEVKEKLDKKLVSGLKGDGEVKHVHFDSISDEADWVAEKINKIKNSKNLSYKDFAILVRSNKDADAFIRSLNMRDIPSRFSGSEGLYSQPEIRFLISWLKFLSNPNDSLSLFYILSFEAYNFKNEVLALLMSKAKTTNRSLYFILRSPDKEDFLGEIIQSDMESFLKDVDEFFQVTSHLDVGQLLYRVINQTGYLKKLAYQGLKSESKIKNIARFFEIIRNISRILSNEDVYTFSQYLESLIDAGDDPSMPEPDYDADAVNILTVHKAKGLEFKIVFLVSLVSERFPIRRRPEAIPLPDELLRTKERWLPEGDPHMQEERRLFYVGMTRAQEALFLTSGQDYGGKRAKKISVFIMESLDLPKQPGVSFKSSAWEVIQRSRACQYNQIAEDKPLKEEDILNLSHLQIDDYFTCPLKYKYIHILRVPVVRHHSVIYGKAVHDAIQVYLRGKIEHKNIALDVMLDVFKNSWRSEGFLTREHEDIRFQEGCNTISKFYRHQESLGTIPSYVEKEFVFLIQYNRISGRWDRIDEDCGKVTIIDYKTSSIDEQDKADKKSKESLQLGVYALAYSKIFSKIPESAQLHFLESDLIGRVSFTEDDLKEVEGKILLAAKGIRERDFSPKPSYLACAYCVFKNICPHTLKGV